MNYSIILNEGNIYHYAIIEERDTNKKWEVTGRNFYEPLGWNIQHGSTKRIIFPVDMKFYLI